MTQLAAAPMCASGTKYTIAFGEFTYAASDEKRHTLMYVSLPPFGRRIYNFEDGQWHQLD